MEWKKEEAVAGKCLGCGTYDFNPQKITAINMPYNRVVLESSCCRQELTDLISATELDEILTGEVLHRYEEAEYWEEENERAGLH